MDYSSMVEIARSLGEKNDCAVKAIAIATGTPYAEVHAELTRQGRKRRSGTYFHQTEGAVKNLGFELQRVMVRSATVRTIARELKTGTYLVRVHRHILCLKEGKVEDWSDGRLHRIVDVHRVVKAGTPEPVVEPTVIKIGQRKAPAPRMSGAKEVIWTVAATMYEQAGSPRSKARVLKLRRLIMDALENEHGVNRNTASTELGNWQKSLDLV